jgi:beta-glucosidase/6-phospho-beta-glucosidase/beta-galactosidase
MKDIYLRALNGFDHMVDTAADTDHSLRSTFKSFWMGGYECSDQLNCFGNRVDLLAETRHLENIHEDYQRLQQFNIYTVREGIRWSKVETVPYQYDFSQVKLMIEAATATGIQQVWDICHFGYPDDLTPVHPQFTNRFVALCKAFIAFYRELIPVGQVIITPINEVGFISWLGGEVGGTSPYGVRMGWDVKYALTRAYIRGIEALKEIDDEVLIMVTEPLVNIVAPLFPAAHEVHDAQNQHEIQYQVVDMLTGRMCPELGGRPGLVDILGLNYYYNNQWIVGTGQFLPWANENDDPRWRSLASLLLEAQNRYHLPVVIAETSHPKEDRPLWITYIAKTCIDALEMGVDLQGICLYPIIDRPDWDHLGDWHHSGLWDANILNPNERHLYEPYAAALLRAQHIVATQMPGAVSDEPAVYKF